MNYNATTQRWTCTDCGNHEDYKGFSPKWYSLRVKTFVCNECLTEVGENLVGILFDLAMELIVSTSDDLWENEEYVAQSLLWEPEEVYEAEVLLWEANEDTLDGLVSDVTIEASETPSTVSSLLRGLRDVFHWIIPQGAAREATDPIEGTQMDLFTVSNE